MSEPEVKQTEVDPMEEFKVYSADGKLLYVSSQEELDDCFYSIISLMSYTKTFNVGSKLKLTFSTISEAKKMDLLTKMREWTKTSDSSSQMFDQQLNKMNLAYYMSYIDMDSNGINLKEKDDKARLEYFDLMAEPAMNLYGTYQYVFMELVRKALINQVSLKNS